MKAFLNSFMFRLGYVPADEASALGVQFEATIASLEALAAIRAALIDAMVTDRIAIAAAKQAPAAAQFATSELVADETSPLILAEMRKQTTLLEVLAKQGDVVMCRGKVMRITFRPATGPDASGLPG